MLLAPIIDEEERRAQHNEYAAAMEDWKEFATTTQNVYGVDMSVLERDFDREQKEYYVLSSRWAELPMHCLLAAPCVVKELDMHVCTVEDARGVGLALGKDEGVGAPFDFHMEGRSNEEGTASIGTTVSGFAGWFTVDFKSRTDDVGRDAAPPVPNPTSLSTGPEMGCEFLCFLQLELNPSSHLYQTYFSHIIFCKQHLTTNYKDTHWGQQVFHLPAAIPVLSEQTTRIQGTMEMMRTKESARLYNVRYRFTTSRKKSGVNDQGVLMKGEPMELVYQIP
jgi:protein arginine N-methyltransferase 1